ncbi:hypothetical protein OHA25_60620 (plasmid) [Nonomuraea sp. NBC_00507]|uniref:hypothetical protein n=1 Tax=Nonomuraea sp. NBC_00507 TaxID=2976002 RepID=UPI002E175C82
MRARAIPLLLEAAVREYFPDDVAEAITSAQDGVLAAAACDAGYAADTPKDLTALVKAIAADVNDRLADWLVGPTARPAAWLARQLRGHMTALESPTGPTTSASSAQGASTAPLTGNPGA